MRTVLLINPVAADGLSPKLARSVVQSLRAVSDVRVVVAEDTGSVSRLARDTVAEGVDALAVLCFLWSAATCRRFKSGIMMPHSKCPGRL